MYNGLFTSESLNFVYIIQKDHFSAIIFFLFVCFID